MKRWVRVLPYLLLIVYCGFTFWMMFGMKGSAIELLSSYQQKADDTKLTNTLATMASKLEAPNEPGIFFVETTDRMNPPALVACSVESAARTYPERTVYFLMKGLANIESISNNTGLFLLASLRNVRILPLYFEEVFQGTPLQSWYQKVDPKTQRFWTQNLSNACREVLVWKYGGIYMDTDVISLRPVLAENFLVAESARLCSSAVLGFRKHHPFLWECMKDYAAKYNGNLWGQQGPGLFSRMLVKLCKIPDFAEVEVVMCQNISYLQSKRFYPIPYTSWERYYGQWEKSKSLFNESYGLHFWNYMNHEHREVTAGSNTTAEHIFMNYCPLTYHSLVKTEHS